MEIINSPNPIDEPNLIYKLQRKLKIFNESDLPNRGYNLVASSSKYGLIFIGIPTSGFAVYYLRDVVNADCAAPPRAPFVLPEAPTHLAVNCDQELLAIITDSHIHLYGVANFQNENNISVSVRCSEDARVRASVVQWNPCQPDTLAAALTDGALLVGQLKGGDLSVSKIPAKARCLCWSPKGKQLVTGNADGTLCQYKPDLTLVKSIPAPDICGGRPVEVLAVQWLSNYQFGVVYRNASDDSRPYVTIVNTPKGGPMVCISYEDICYSMGSSRPWYYYLHSVAQWGILMAASSNSVEVATLGSSDSANWVQWCQLDEAKPELPLTDRKQDNYPVGLAFDTAAIHQLPWGENETLPHMPLLLVLSHTGLLAVFNVVNLRPGAPQLCEPPRPLALPPHLLLTEGPPPPPAPAAAPAPPPPAAAPAPPPPAAAPAPPPPAPSHQVEAPAQLAASRSHGAQVGIPSQPPVAAQASPAAFGLAQANASHGQVPTKPAADVVPQRQTKPPAPAQPAFVQSAQGEPAAEAGARGGGGGGGGAHKSEELRAAAARAGEETTSALLGVVNNFQAGLHEALRRARDVDMAVEMSSVRALSDTLQQLNAAHIEKECSLEWLTGAVAELKLDVIRTCALLADVRCKARVVEGEMERKVEPLCARTLESVRRQLHHVHTRVQQADCILHNQWTEVYARFHGVSRRGENMTTPVLDAVYQPLVKQQEILSRQQATVRALQTTLQQEIYAGAGTILKSFNKDPLAKLTRNVLNMSLERGGGGGGGGGCAGGLPAHKLEALREVLANHKTTRIKTLNVEVQRHLASVREARERRPPDLRLKEELCEGGAETQSNAASTKQDVPKPNLLPALETVASDAKVHPVTKPEPPQTNALNLPTERPTAQAAGLLNWAQQAMSPGGAGNTVTITASNIASLGRNMYGVKQPPSYEIKSAVVTDNAGQTDKTIPTSNADSVIVGLLQNKSSVRADKDEANTFMGQKICSPTTATATAGSPFGSSTAFTYQPAAQAFGGTNLQSPFGAADSKSFAFNQSKPSELPTQSSNQKPSELARALKGPKSTETGEVQNENRKPDLKTLAQDSSNGTAKEAQSSFGKTSLNQPGVKTSQIEERLAGMFEEPVPKPPEAKSNAPESEVKSEGGAPPSPAVASDGGGSFSFLSAAPRSPTGSIFAAPQSPNSKGGSIFGGSSGPSSIFGSPPTASASAPPGTPPSAASVFGAANTTLANNQAGTPTASSAAPSAAATSVFVATAATSATPGSVSAGSIFGAPAASSASLFGATSPAATTLASLFGSASPAPSTVASVFGATSSAPSTAAPVFGATSITKNTVTSVFGAASSTASTVAPLFGSTVSPASTVASVFGATSPGSPVASPSSVFGATTPAASTVSSVFGAASPAISAVAPALGGASPAASTVAPVFGSSSPTTTTVASVFGAPSPTTSTVASVFGASSPASTTVAPVFGASSPATSTVASVFGAASPAAGTPASVFGGAATAATTPASVFGAAAPGGATPVSVFGASQSASGGSVFGAQSDVFGRPTAQAAQSVFAGGDPSSMFGAVSISTTSAPPAQPANVFAASAGSSVFGGGAGVFGAKPAFGAAGAAAPAQTVFGGNAFGQQKPAANVFGGGASSFGSTFSSPSATPAGASLFGGGGGGGGGGGTSAFGAATPPASPASVFGSPQHSPASAFGGGAVFGSKPVFGQPAGFGGGGGGGGAFSPGFAGGASAAGSAFGAPVFGGGAFGSTSPSKLFGGGSPGFGAPMQQSSTFENLASQNTLSFGNLAQHSPPQQQPPAFNTSPSFSGWRG